MAEKDYTDSSLVCTCGGTITKRFKSGKPGKFCDACMRLNNPKKLDPTPKRHLVCYRCGKSFYGIKGQKYCCPQCRITSGNRRHQEAARDRGKRICPFCGVEFAPAYGEHRQKYCSVECRIKYVYKTRSGSTHRRRAKKFGVSFSLVRRAEVFDRDGWRCQICGKSTPKKMLGTKKHNAPELDHRVPMSKGGDHCYANVQCTCRECNISKGNATTVGQLPLFDR